MTRGTTPYYVIKFKGVEMDDIDRVVFTIEQSKNGVEFTVPDEQMHRGEKGFWCRLTQEQTLQFAKGSISFQVRFRLKSTNAWAAKIGTDTVNDVLLEEVI